MTNDRDNGIEPSDEKREANQAAGRKHLGENGLPQKSITPKQQDAADRTKMTVTQGPEPSPQEVDRAMGKD
jgi:hypothetical protein